MISRTCHVRHVSCDRFDLPHEFIASCPIFLKWNILQRIVRHVHVDLHCSCHMQNLQYARSCHTFPIESPVEVLAMIPHWCSPCRHTLPILVTRYLKEMSWTRRCLTNHNHYQFCNLKSERFSIWNVLEYDLLLTKSCIWGQIRGEDGTMNVFFSLDFASILK